ncbi:hypothetical protein [Natronosalvus rutilus]|uniref:Uncharacterized protein n=1 Tax=Natronosalvus rutilus TaxID=2953753 RepID=A0A9E7NBD9_9EURY|nr:hypothetical protein [Natronosalvus rutilus]UTF53572.1 hypothetical protein NGM29_17680 [Natronosalvus rutilus]
MTRDRTADRSDTTAREERPPAERRDESAAGAWAASTALQTAVAVVGLTIVLFALGQAFGVDLLGVIAGALGTQVGMWLAIAFIVLLFTGAALRAVSFGTTRA